jgi:hypothetical protein
MSKTSNFLIIKALMTTIEHLKPKLINSTIYSTMHEIQNATKELVDIKIQLIQNG